MSTTDSVSPADLPPAARLLDPTASLLLVIDLQDKFVPYLWRKERLLSGTRLLLDAARALRVPVLVSEHNPRAIGPTVAALRPALRDAPVLPKLIFSCLGDEGLRAHLAGLRTVRQLVLCGCEAHICVLQTALEALAAGYVVHVAADAVGSRMELDWRTGLARLRQAGAVISTAEMTAYEWLRRADRPEFKALLPAFKDWTTRVGE